MYSPEIIPAGTTIGGLHFIQDWRVEVRHSSFLRGYIIVSDAETFQQGIGVSLKEAREKYVDNLRAYLIQNWAQLPPWMRIGFRVVKHE